MKVAQTQKKIPKKQRLNTNPGIRSTFGSCSGTTWVCAILVGRGKTKRALEVSLCRQMFRCGSKWNPGPLVLGGWVSRTSLAVLLGVLARGLALH